MRDHPEAMRRGGRRRRTVGALAGLLLGLPLACRGDLPVAPEPGGVSSPSSAAVPTASRAPDAGDAAAAPSPTGASPRAPRPSDAGNASLAIELVDHASFRRFSPDPAVYERDMRQLRTNLDAARALGIRRYVIFGDELERLLTYDVDLAGIEGGLGRRAFPADGSWRREAALYRDLMRWAIDAAAARKVGLVLHANQIELPEPVLTLLQGRVVEGDTICADRELTWTLYRAKLGELFDALPGLAGLQITADETEQGLGRCDGPEADPDTPAGAEALLARVDRLLNESAAVARPRGIEIEGRSWGRIYALEEQLDPDRMFDGLDPGIVLSLKNTRGDFHRFSPPSPLIGRGDGARQVLEFDAWREHEGWNLYPCYMGDEWAPRVAAARAAGIRRLALRIGWDQPVQPLFETPWGNGVNLALLRGLAADADADPDRLLRDWIDATWPEGSRAAAFRLYKQSPALMTAVHAQGSEAATDHSRLFRLRDGVDAFERIDGRLGWLQKAGELRKAGDFAARRAAIDAAYADAEALVDALGEDAPAGWRSELAAGARAQWRVGRGATDQLELRFWTREGAPVPPAGRLEALKSQAAADNADWLAEDPERYRLLEGAQLPALLDRLP